MRLVWLRILLVCVVSAGTICAHAADQGSTSSTTLQGFVLDSTGAAIPGATVDITNARTNFHAQAMSDAQGQYRFVNLGFNNYHVVVSIQGFSPAQFDADLHSPVAVNQNVTLALASQNQVVNVNGDASDLIETEPSAHTDVSQQMIERLPMNSAASAMTSVITQSTPGMTQDSNGMFHPLGEHADSTFSIDGQPVSDQQSRTFANQIPINAVQSLEVINGIIPPEYGDKASAVIRTTTKSGLATPMHGSIQGSYGSFGTADTTVSLLGGTKAFGNFFTAELGKSGRFLDSPEFQPLHDKGNSESIFDRLDWQPSQKNAFHLNLNFSRSWFQIPNQFDQQLAGQDQRQQNKGIDISLFYSRVIDDTQLLTGNVYYRQDRVQYYPSADPFNDLPATLQQTRRLSNAGIKLDYALVKGAHNLKAGVNIYHTLLSEEFATGITDPTFNDPASPTFQPGLAPYDLTRGGSLFTFRGHGDIRQQAFYLQDNITLGAFQFLAGVRGDNYVGLSSDHSIQPRLGATYNLKKTNTVFRLGYGRMLVTPYNENLVLSSSTGIGGLESGASAARPLRPGNRNQFDAGFQQTIGKYLIIDGEYFWKFTHRDFDFNAILNTPLTFPIEWRKSKIDGFALRVTMPNYHGLTANAVFGHVRSRFFGPEVGGLLFNSPTGNTDFAPFRIDHDQALEQTTHFQYQPKKEGGWVGFSWRYDSGQVAGNVPDIATAFGFTPDQQQQIGMACSGIPATLSAPITSCSGTVTFERVRVPANSDPDRNPPRITPRHLFDMAAGWENVFHRDRYKTNLTFTAVNLTNEVALYNFLSTFSGTHFVSPRTFSGQVEFSF